jgi:hypothetical protein
MIESDLPVLGFIDVEVQVFDDPSRHDSDNLGIIDDQR